MRPGELNNLSGTPLPLPRHSPLQAVSKDASSAHEDIRLDNWGPSRFVPENPVGLRSTPRAHKHKWLLISRPDHTQGFVEVKI